MIKTLSKSVREFRRPAILTPCFVIFEVILEVAIPYLMSLLIDNGINLGNMSYIWIMGIILVVGQLLALFFGILSGYMAARASAGFAKNLRKDMYYNIQNFSFANIDRFSSSSLITRLTTDATNVQNSFQMLTRIAIRCPIMLVFALIMTFSISWKLALIYLGVAPVLGLGLFFIIKKAYPIYERSFKKYDKLNNVVQENLRGIRVVKSYVREDFEEDKFNATSDSVKDDFTKAEKLLAINNPLMQFCVYSCILLISWIGANMIITTGDLTTGQLMSVFSYTMQILMSLMMFSMVIVMITISKASATRICEVLDEKSDLHNPETPIYDIKNGDIEFENVDFSYAKDVNKVCLAGVNLKIKSGETVGIIGGTGSSKTTLIQLIPRLYDATTGSVKVGDIDVREYDIESLRNQVAVVLQKNVLFSGTIKENMRWGNEDATDEQIIEACKLAQADNFIQQMPSGYDTYIEQGGSNVSGGQKQRLCIARALLKSPKVLILDDSTSAVDTKTDSLIRKSFKEFIPNITKIIIAQRIASVQDADKIIVLNNGKVDGFGTHDELMASNEIYNEVYTSQNKGGK